jgi:hypothetical protein
VELHDNWVGIEGELNGNPFLVRAREALESFIETHEYNHRVDIVWKYQSSNEALMPDDKTMEEMDKVEDTLAVFLENDLHAILSFVYMGNSEKVWYWYSKDINETANRINGALADLSKLPIELHAHEDPTWKEYKNVMAIE